MNTRKRTVMSTRILMQAVEGATEVATETPVVSTKVKDTDFGAIYQGTFSITVKSGDKVIYTSKAEPFQYEKVEGFSNVLKHSGAKLEDTQINFLNQALSGSEETGIAVKELIDMYNDRLKANAKSAAYAAVTNKHKPLEGEDRETAIAKTIRGFVKLAGISVETAIEVLKSKGAVPEDYTVADYNTTPLRRTKGGEDED
jgi:hypothetical protein